MNYYIDFDNTLYETAKLTGLMLKAIGDSISKLKNIESEIVIQDAKDNFNSSKDNIYTFAEQMADKYNTDKELTVQAVKDVVANGKELVFEDAERFLIKLREKGHKIFLLTFLPKTNQEYQMQKVNGSGIAKYFDGIIMTTEYKFLLDIKYENGIFIDDDPRDLNGLYANNPIKVIRIRKENNKRSKIDLENKDIKEYTSFDDIEIEE